jgi:hypothetical protein
MLRRVALVRTDVSQELSASFIRVTIGELGTTLAVTSNRRTLVKVVSQTAHGEAQTTCLISSSGGIFEKFLSLTVREIDDETKE